MTEDTVSSTHPLLPPTSEDDRLDRLRLLRSRRVGISTYYRLMAEHVSATAALEALPEIARDAGMAGYRALPAEMAETELRAGRRFGAQLIFRGEADYPERLLDLSDAPPVLWVRGDISLLKRPSLALVGARNASSLATRMTRILAKDLGAEGYVITSGLARGVDSAAHLAALKTGTIAVFGGGIDVIYPSENTRLGEDVMRDGLVISEQPLGLSPVARHFPVRNRLISGLTQAMIVVEAAPRSGSMDAAKHALDQGREVMAVPGHPLEPRAAGSNMLLRDGARLVRSADDVIEALAPLAANAPSQPQLALDDPTPPATRTLRDVAALHDEILARLDPAPMTEDHLIRALRAPTQAVNRELVDLEIEGRIERQTGGMVRRLN